MVKVFAKVAMLCQGDPRILQKSLDQRALPQEIQNQLDDFLLVVKVP